jgi:hypothetical protein
MSESSANSTANLNSVRMPPLEIYNLPGSDSLRYRIGTHGLFKTSMYYDLVSKEQFRRISKRDDDLSLSLIDCWALVSDVLSFYQEQIANEGFLRTAKERLSVLELSKSVGRKLRHGLAATTFLSFTLDDIPNKITKATIDTKTKVQSIPEQGELPQVFETVEKFDASSEWNSVKPKLTEKQHVLSNSKEFIFEGVSLGLRPGDDLLIVVMEKNSKVVVDKIFLKIINANTDQKLQTTTVVIDSNSQNFQNILSRDNTFFDFSFFSFQHQAGLFGHNASHKYLKQKKYYSLSLQNDGNYSKYFRDVLDSTRSQLGDKNIHVKGIEKDPRYQKDVKRILGSYRRKLYYEIYYSISDFSFKKNRMDGFLYLDNVYSEIIPDSWIVLRDQEKYDAYQVNDLNSISLNDFELNFKVSVLKLDNVKHLDQYKLHETTAYVSSKKLTLAKVAVAHPISNSNLLVTLEKKVNGLKEKQFVSIVGSPENNPEHSQSEISQVIKVQTDPEQNTVVELSGLEKKYRRDTVSFNFNVVKATHGETRHEILGSGNPSQIWQTFVLKGKPLTHVLPDGKKSGSTLEVKINDELWEESDDFLDLKPDDKSYVTEIDDDGNVSVIFGDGIHGMRTPAGMENIHADYRLGMGKKGMVRENQLNLLLNRALGVRSVTNHVPASNASDPEDLNAARKNTPIKLLTMDRIVSLGDFEDYAESFEGVEKALAISRWNGLSEIVHLIVADSKGQNADSILRKSLEQRINLIKDPMIQFYLGKFKRKSFDIQAKILIDKKLQFEKIKLNVIQNLSAEFSFEKRQFGQDVTLGEVMTIIQKTKGVVAVDVDKLFETGQTSVLRQNISSSKSSTRHQEPAVELLTINDKGILISEILQ